MARTDRNFKRSKQRSEMKNMSKDTKDLAKLNKTQFNKRNSNKNQRRDKEIADTAIKASATNDYSWYSRFPQFTKDAGSLAFGVPLGQPLIYGDTTKYNLPLIVPGLMVLKFTPGVGYSKDLTSPINRSAAKFYTYLRNVQKAAAKYDSADIMINMMAIDSLMMFHANLKRAYGIASLYTPVNKYYPRYVLGALGFDKSILDNLAEFRAYINQLGVSLGSFCLPKSFDITMRHQWMCEGLYVDSQTTRAQTYAFVPNGFWKYDNTATVGSSLTWVDWASKTSAVTRHTLDQIKEMGKELINAILLDQDTGNIAGDLYAAFGPENLFKLTEVSESFIVLPSYDETVLSQINNASIVGEHADGYTPVITQNPSVNNGAIIYKPQFDGTYKLTGETKSICGMTGRAFKPINMYCDSPTAEQVIEATRLSVCSVHEYDEYTELSSYDHEKYQTVIGSDVINRIYITVLNQDGSFKNLSSETDTIWFEDAKGVSIMQTRADMLALSSVFDWGPMLWKGKIAGTTPGAKTPTLEYPCFDVDNITIASAQQLANMHEAALLSMLDLPQMGM